MNQRIVGVGSLPNEKTQPLRKPVKAALFLGSSLAKHIFVDESGDPYIDTEKQGVSSHFVLAATIVPTADLVALQERAWTVIRKHFKDAEMKSSAVGSNQKRRKLILTDLSMLPIQVYALVVDKAEVFKTSGLRFKGPFMKFIHRRVYTTLVKTFNISTLMSDEHGGSDFMQGFQAYVSRQVPSSLFESFSFNFGNSKTSPLIQFSDMIAGSIARICSGKDKLDLLEPLGSRVMIIEEWPVPSHGFAVVSETQAETDRQWDVLVSEQALTRASRFLDAHLPSEELEIQAQVAVVRYLLYFYRYVDPEQYIPTPALGEHLAGLGLDISEHMLRSKVIAKLRDNEVFVVSSNKGLKLPYTVNELRVFAKMVEDQVIPYLSRLQIIRNYFYQKSDGAIDIADPKVQPGLAYFLKYRKALES